MYSVPLKSGIRLAVASTSTKESAIVKPQAAPAALPLLIKPQYKTKLTNTWKRTPIPSYIPSHTQP